jgi:hypothetical protein
VTDTTTPPREYRVDPDDPDRVVSYSGTTASDGTRLWNDPWNATYLGDEDVEGWTRLIPDTRDPKYAEYDAQGRAEVIALISRQAKRIAQLEAAPVRELHRETTYEGDLHPRPTCTECRGGTEWPCPTLAALDGDGDGARSVGALLAVARAVEEYLDGGMSTAGLAGLYAAREALHGLTVRDGA